MISEETCLRKVDTRRGGRRRLSTQCGTHLAELVVDPAALESLAVEHESTRGLHAVGERDRPADLDHRINAMLDEIAEEYSGLGDKASIRQQRGRTGTHRCGRRGRHICRAD